MGKKYLNETFRDEWDSIGDQSIYHENEEELPENQTFTVTIVQPPSAVIEVVVNETEVHTATFVANWNDTYTVRFRNGSNPNNLILNALQGKIARDITIRSYDYNPDNKHEVYTVTIQQSANQTISVLHNNVIKVKSFSAQKYDYYNASISAIEGYVAGEIRNGSGTITGNVVVSASPATIISSNYRTLTITQSEHQTIVVRYNNKNYTNSFAAPVGSRYTVSIVPEEGYTAGTIVDGGRGTLSNNFEVHASSATVKKYTITIVQSPHQTIKVRYNNEEYTETVNNVPYGTQLVAVVEPDDGYDRGRLNATTYRVTANFTFECTEEAKLRYYDITIPATTNQTITLSYKLPGESEYEHEIVSGASTNTINVPHGTEWKTAVIPVSEDYSVGTVTPSFGVANNNISLVITAALLKQFPLIINTPVNGYIVVEIDGEMNTYTTDTTIMVQKDKVVNLYAISYNGFKIDRIDVL